jgi:uncharacterized protein
MAVELRPLGVRCNLQCQYCYQHPQRDAANIAHSYDMSAMKQALIAGDSPFTLFGGEPLLMAKDDLAQLWALGHEHHGTNAIQTNGTLIDAEHIRMFRRYAVRVGLSLDGPAAHNDARWLGTLPRTRLATQRAQRALEQLCDEGIPVGLIVTLHSTNASPARLPVLLSWVRALAARGLRALRLHLLESDNSAVRDTYALSDQHNILAMRGFLALSRELPRLQVEPFEDMRRMLMGEDESAGCTWRGCDPYNTEAVQGIEGDGSRSNCGRTNKDGIDFQPAETRGMERSLALHCTPQQHGGCQGCRFFLMCKGQCPGTALHGDWRNRSEHCAVWKALYTDMEALISAAGKRPLSLSSKRPALEHSLAAAWRSGENITLARLLHVTVQPRRSVPPPPRHPLPDFLRITWTSPRAQSLWEPRLQRIRAAWTQAQWQSVRAGVRPCALLLATPAVALDHQQLALHGLTVAGLWSGRLPSSPRGYAVVIGANPATVAEFRHAWEHDHHDRIGELLGYPPCCRRSHQQLSQQDVADPIWQLAAASAPFAHDEPHVVQGLPHSNILWRALGVQPVPHTPCSFTCTHSAALAHQIRAAAQQAGVDAPALDWRDQILSWPAEWSALHGIAETKGPVVKFATRTDVTAERRIVRFAGTTLPDEAANGIAFPYQAAARRPRVTSGASFRRGIHHAAGG